MERVGLRLALRKQQARAGDITLLFGDESEALTHPYLARAWAKRGADLRVPAPGQSRKIAMMGVLDFVTRKLVAETSRTKKSGDFIALLRRLDHLFGPRPGVAMKPVVLVLDNGPIHKSRATLAALAERVASGKFDAPNTATGPMGRSIMRMSWRGAGLRSGRAASWRRSR